MKNFIRFIAVGSFFSTVEEFLTVFVLRGDFASYVFTLLILFPAILTAVYLSSRILDSLIADERRREIAHFFLFGLLGLMFEWFVMKLSPWSNPNANPVLMLVFQLGMFSFWATVTFAPRLFMKSDEHSRRTQRAILRFYIPYFLIAYVLAFLVPESLKFATIIGLIICGYLFLNVFYVRYFVSKSIAVST